MSRVVPLMTPEASGGPYTRPRPDRLSVRAGAVFTAAALALAGLSFGGCSYKLGSMLDRDKKDETETTGSIRKNGLVENDNPTEIDLSIARDAASDALTKGDNGSSFPWENPQTGARGSITPVASSYTSETGSICRDFIASYVQGAAQTWLQGDACQSNGRWQVRNMRPWKRS